MLKRKRKNKTISYLICIFFFSFLFLIALNLIFPQNSWFKKTQIISPIVKNSSSNTENFEKILTDFNIGFTSINPYSNYLEINLKDGGNIYISLEKDTHMQLSSLQAILKQLTINGKRFNLIDFRFDKPLILY